MRVLRWHVALMIVFTAVVNAQNPPTGGQRGAEPPATPGGRGGRGGGRGVQVMTLSTTALPDASVCFVLIVHDPDAATGNGTDDILHWMLWNIPGEARGLPEGVPQGSQ